MSGAVSLGDRMKQYEAPTQQVLPRRTYSILRVDGRAFHTLLKHAERPFDTEFMTSMDATAISLCKEIAGAQFAYIQSDEISVLFTDFEDVHTEPWFGGSVQKIASVSASIASAYFNRNAHWAMEAAGRQNLDIATFDSRVFTIPDQVEVANYFLWRQRDWVRNSVTMAARACFGHGRLRGLHQGQLQELLWSEAGINWNNYPDMWKRGRVVHRYTTADTITYTDTRTRELRKVESVRSRWVCVAAPHFVAQNGNWLATMIPARPSLNEGDYGNDLQGRDIQQSG